MRYPFLILCVVKCTINKQQRGSSMAHHTPPPLHIPPHVFCRLRGPDMELIHSAGSRSDITLCVCGEGSAWAWRHACYRGPASLTLSAPLLFGARQKSGLFGDLWPGLSCGWTGRTQPSSMRGRLCLRGVISVSRVGVEPGMSLFFLFVLFLMLSAYLQHRVSRL